MGDRGSASVLTIFVALAITASAAAAVAPVLGDLLDRQRASAAADAAALAGVTGGRAAAAEIAAANGGVLLAWSREGHRVTVTVVVGDLEVVASATDQP